MKLSDYIEKHYNGSQADFAKDNSFDRQIVWRMLQKGYWHVYDGMLMMHKHDVKQEGLSND